MPLLSNIPNSRSRWLFAIVFLLGAGIRLIWPTDMEWKADEKLMYELAQQSAVSGTLPDLGMTSGVGLINSGFSVWPFVLFYKILAAPVFMAVCVMCLNILALLLMLRCASKLERDKEILRFGILIAAVNVMAVILSRKIWAQDLLPIFIALLWWLHLHRNKLLAVFLWGLFSALAGQLHMSGFYYALGLFIAAGLYRQWNLRNIWFFIVGFGVGMIPAMHWLQYVLGTESSGNSYFSNLFKFEFPMHAVLDPLGVNIVYSLGSDWKKFAMFPFVGSTGLFLPAIFSAIIVVMVLLSFWKSGKAIAALRFEHLKERPAFFYILAFVLIPGILITFSGIPVRSHYLIGALPFLHSALAWVLMKAGKNNLWIVIFSQLAITLLFLIFVHQSNGISGDYGIPYSRQ